MSNQNANGRSINEDTPVKSTLGRTIVAIGLIVSFVFSVGMGYANLTGRVEDVEAGKLDRSEYERRSAVDSVNQRNMFIKVKEMDYKIDKLLEKENIRVPKNNTAEEE